MNELISKLKEAGKTEAFNSPEKFSAAAKALGASEEEISAAIGGISFPLSDDDLEDVAGGLAARCPTPKNTDRRKTPISEVRCSRCGNYITIDGVTYDRSFDASTYECDNYRDEIKYKIAHRMSTQRCPLGGVCDPVKVRRS